MKFMTRAIKKVAAAVTAVAAASVLAVAGQDLLQDLVGGGGLEVVEGGDDVDGECLSHGLRLPSRRCGRRRPSP